MIVVPTDAEYWAPAHREVAVTLDDILIEDGKVAPFIREDTTYVAMGRFGNVDARRRRERSRRSTPSVGEVVRFYFTNTANTRVFNVGVRGRADEARRRRQRPLRARGVRRGR